MESSKFGTKFAFGDSLTKIRYRRWSEETGYQTAEQTPLPTPVKNRHAPYLEKSSDFNEESVFFNESNLEESNLEQTFYGVNDVGQQTRAITKNPENERAIVLKKHLEIYELAEKLVDYRLELASHGIWCFDDEEKAQQSAMDLLAKFGYQSVEEERGGWKYPKTVTVNVAPGRRRYKKKKPQETCEFCRNNGTEGWETHQCHDEFGNVVCPELFELRCPNCGATGASAHTKRYCPKAQRRNQRRIELQLMAKPMSLRAQN